MQAAEDTRDPRGLCLAYPEDSARRTRGTFVAERDQIVEFLTQKWERELDSAVRKELCAFDGNRIAVRFQYESRDQAGQWGRNYGYELGEFDDSGLMRRREASTNDMPIEQKGRRISRPRTESERTSSPCGKRASPRPLLIGGAVPQSAVIPVATNVGTALLGC